MLVRNDMYAVISTARLLAITNAHSAIRNNNKFAYIQADEMYNFLNNQIARDTECAFLDARIPSEPFPEWPPASMRPVFSDEEIATWPVMFSDGSVIDDDDVPF